MIEDPQPELDKLAKSLNAVDYSRISESSCGKFALVVAPSAIHFYEWGASGWTQNDSRFGDWTPEDPYLVTTRDYTNDGTPEFLINFARKFPIGAVFGQVNCDWKWLPFQPQMGNEQRTVDALTWSDDYEELWGDDYDKNWTKMTSTYEWDPHYETFFAQDSSVGSGHVYNEPDTSETDSGGGVFTPSESIIRVECSLRDTGMSSNWQGTYYSWTYYNIWSNGTRTVAKTGQGYNPPTDC
jgi:hypothetical protein